MNRSTIHTVLYRSLVIALGMVVLTFSGCTAFREVANLRNVDFRIDRVSQGQLAGVNIENIESYRDLSASDIARLSASLADQEMPLSFVLHLEATNPSENETNARLTEMDWTLLLEDKETVSGTFDREIVLKPGDPQDVPIDIELDLIRFFDDNLRGLVELASAVGGEGPPQNLKVQVQPTIQTPLGPIRYSSPVTVVSQDVGQEDQS